MNSQVKDHVDKSLAYYKRIMQFLTGWTEDEYAPYRNDFLVGVTVNNDLHGYYLDIIAFSDYEEDAMRQWGKWARKSPTPKPILIKNMDIFESYDFKVVNSHYETSLFLGTSKEISKWDITEITQSIKCINAQFKNANISVHEWSSSGCYVATAVYGSYDCPEVWTLSRFRDRTLSETWYGRLFIRFYYAVSPVAVKYFGNMRWFKNMFKKPLDKLVQTLNSKGFENTPYYDQKEEQK